MNVQRNPNRPKLPERHLHLLGLKEVNEFIEDLEVAYEETGNEKVFRVLKKLVTYRNAELDLEEFYRSEELQEFWNNPGAFPHAVRMWFFQYRDKEMDL